MYPKDPVMKVPIDSYVPMGAIFGRILTSYALTAPSSRQSCRVQPLAQFSRTITSQPVSGETPLETVRNLIYGLIFWPELGTNTFFLKFILLNIRFA